MRQRNIFYRFIVKLVNFLDNYFGADNILERAVKFTKLLNDIRFDYVDESVYHERILPFDQINKQKD